MYFKHQHSSLNEQKGSVVPGTVNELAKLYSCSEGKTANLTQFNFLNKTFQGQQ